MSAMIFFHELKIGDEFYADYLNRYKKIGDSTAELIEYNNKKSSKERIRKFSQWSAVFYLDNE